MFFYQGETRERTVQRIQHKFGVAVPVRTLASWLAEYRDLTTYAPMRKAGMAAFPPDRLVRSVRLHHRRVHEYCVHQGKLGRLLQEAGQRSLAPIADYLVAMLTDCPDALFSGEAHLPLSALPFDIGPAAIRRRHQQACRVAGLIVPATAVRRHQDELRQFMLATDSATVAVEVPVYLTAEDREPLQAAGIDVRIESDEARTGHIDVLQIRGGRIHILAYEPGADEEKPAAELMLHALALSRRTGLQLSDFVCAWFNERGYHEFDPVLAVR